LDKIVGSVNRFEDFDRRFLPRNQRTMGRWKWIDRAWHNETGLPPIEVIRVGDIYFVKDGNHRVSVARQHGQEFIDAEVVEEHLRAPLSPDMSTEELLLQAEYAEFLRLTDLDRLRPEHDIRPTGLGSYAVLRDHIQTHRRWLEENLEKRPVPPEEAVTRWYDNVYLPLVRVMREHRIHEQCAGRSEADMYLWAMARCDELYDLYTRTHDPQRSANEYIAAMDARTHEDGWLSRMRDKLRRTRPRGNH
jgi:hypothetical protein